MQIADGRKSPAECQLLREARDLCDAVHHRIKPLQQRLTVGSKRRIFRIDHDVVEEAIDRSAKSCKRSEHVFVATGLEKRLGFGFERGERFEEGLFGVFRKEFFTDFCRHFAFNLLQNIADALVSCGQRLGFGQLHEAADRGQACRQFVELFRVEGQHGINLERRIAGIAKHNAESILEEAEKFGTMISHAGNSLFGLPGSVDERAETHRQLLFDQHAENA